MIFDVEINSAAHYPAAEVPGLIELAEQVGFRRILERRIEQHRSVRDALGGGEPNQNDQARHGDLSYLRPQPGDAGNSSGDAAGSVRRPFAARPRRRQQGDRRLARRGLRPAAQTGARIYRGGAQSRRRRTRRIRGRDLSTPASAFNFPGSRVIPTCRSISPASDRR